MTDLFDEARGMARNSDPPTSYRAAASILPKRYTIRQQVEEFARSHGAIGFIDEQLEEAFPLWAPSSWRTRRSELAQDMVLLDSGRTRQNVSGRDMIVWVHRDFHPCPPPKAERQPQVSKADQIVRLEAEVKRLRLAMEAAVRQRHVQPVMCATASRMADILNEALN